MRDRLPPVGPYSMPKPASESPSEPALVGTVASADGRYLSRGLWVTCLPLRATDVGRPGSRFPPFPQSGCCELAEFGRDRRPGGSTLKLDGGPVVLGASGEARCPILARHAGYAVA